VVVTRGGRKRVECECGDGQIGAGSCGQSDAGYLTVVHGEGNQGQSPSFPSPLSPFLPPPREDGVIHIVCVTEARSVMAVVSIIQCNAFTVEGDTLFIERVTGRRHSPRE
jgi:hypothetical protein